MAITTILFSDKGKTSASSYKSDRTAFFSSKMEWIRADGSDEAIKGATDEVLKDFLRLVWIFVNAAVYMAKPNPWDSAKGEPIPSLQYNFVLKEKNKLPTKPIDPFPYLGMVLGSGMLLFFSDNYAPGSRHIEPSDPLITFGGSTVILRFLDYFWRQIKLDSNTLEDPLELSGSHMRKFVDRLWEIAH